MVCTKTICHLSDVSRQLSLVRQSLGMHPCVADETACAALAEGLVEVNAYERNKLPRLVASLAILIAISSVSLLSTAFVLWMSIQSAPDF